MCIALVSDMPDLLADSRAHNVFFNKYLEEDDHVVMNCAEQAEKKSTSWQIDCPFNIICTMIWRQQYNFYSVPVAETAPISLQKRTAEAINHEY